MNAKKALIVIIIAVALLLLVILVRYNFFIPIKYEPFNINPANINGTSFCEEYTKSCTCYGSLIATMTYPPGFQCTGFNVCVEHELEVRNCR